jgi:hypothetical protein
MTPLRQASTRAPRRSSSDPDADLVRALGPDHELVRTQRTLSVTIRRASETSALVLATPCLSLLSRDLAIAAASSAALVASILWGAAAVFGSQRRRRVHDLILQERAPQLGLIDAEVRRLLDPRHRARSAQALRRALYEGEHWHDFLPASRPPPGVRHLTSHAHVIRDIARDLDGEGITPRAVILVDQLIEGGYGAAIYQGGPDRVGRELGRLRFELTGKRVAS